MVYFGHEKSNQFCARLYTFHHLKVFISGAKRTGLMPHLKKWFPCGGFGSDDVDSVVHGEGETEEANPVAMPHTARASLEMAIEVGEIPIFQRKNK